MEHFNLRDTTRQLAEDTGEVDPGRLADKLIEAIPFEAQREVLHGLLREYCRHYFTDTRKPGVVLAEDRDTTVAGSGRWKAVRERYLDSRYPVGAEWKLLRDFTADDCATAASAYRVRAVENTVWADRFTRLEEAVRTSRRSTVAGLSARVLEEVMAK